LVFDAARHGRITRLGLITSQAFSLPNFRGTFIRELVAHGVQVYALAPDYDARTRSAVRELGAEPVDFDLERAALSPVRDVLALVKMAFLIKRLGLDAVISYFIKPVIYGTLAARMARVPHRYCLIEGAGYVFSEERLHSNKKRLLRSVVSQLYRTSLRHAEKVFFLNPDDVALFREFRMVEESKAIMLGAIGVDLHEMAMAPPIIAPIVFILVARLLKEKGIYDYVAAAKQIKARYPGARFLLVGGVDFNPASLTEDEVRSWVGEGVIEWAGRVSDVRPWLARASVFVLPSYYREGVPRSTQEAMAMGRPVITTDSPGCRETVITGRNGFLVPPRSSEALVAAMLRFIEEPELIVSMGQESRRMAEERFDARRVNRRLLAELGLNVGRQECVSL
jgi:glycosyltransferase involved in cell wall biosynthesis